MSIVLSASPWNSSGTRKRIPKLNSKKTLKQTVEEPDEEPDDLGLENFKETMEENLTRNDRVNELLNKVTDAGGGLADFKPAPRQTASLADLMPSKTLSPEKKEGFVSNIRPNSVGDSHVSSYDRLYDPKQVSVLQSDQKPYYANQSQTYGNDKLNHIIRILEELQMEKTSNITEELVLYSFLGVFMIFIVDSFAKAGKYYR